MATSNANTRCPHCGTSYKVPPERLQQTLRCKQCGRSFQALPLGAPPSRPVFERERASAAMARRRGVNPLVILGALGGAAAVALVIFQMMPEREPAPPPVDEPAAAAPPAPAAVADPLAHPALKRVQFLRSAVRNGNLDAIALQLDAAAWYSAEAAASAARWTALGAAEQDRFRKDLAKRTSENPAALALAEHEPTSAVLASDASGRLEFTLRSGALADQFWRVGFTGGGEDWRIASLVQERDAPPPAPVEAEKPKRDPNLFAILPTEEEGAERDAGGEIQDEDGKAYVFRGTIQRVDWLAATTPEQRSKIEGLLPAALADEGRATILATRELVNLAPHSIPPLLNRLVDLPLSDDPERLEQINAVDALLFRISGRQSGFPMPGRSNITDPAKLRERRRLCLEAWFGWWNLYGEHWDAWRKVAGLPDPPPDRRQRP